MAEGRLKDRIEWNPPPSRYASWLGALLVLVAIVAVYFSLADGQIIKQALRSFQSTPPAVPGQLTLTAAKHQTFYWNGQGPYLLDEVGPRLAAWLPTVANPQVVIVAEANAHFGDAARLLDEVRRQGVTHLRLEARAP